MDPLLVVDESYTTLKITQIQIQIQIQIRRYAQVHLVAQVEEGEEFSSTEELNPDCYVVVYAVDDEQSFG